MSPLGLFLVFIALTTISVYAVAPVREIGILIGTVMGARLLVEGQARRRLVAAAMMLGGVVLLALGYLTPLEFEAAYHARLLAPAVIP